MCFELTRQNRILASGTTIFLTLRKPLLLQMALCLQPMQSNNVQLLKGPDTRGLAPLISFLTEPDKLKVRVEIKAYSDVRHSSTHLASIAIAKTAIKIGKQRGLSSMLS